MQKYRVISGSCVGKNKVYRYNDIILATDVDDAEKRVTGGFLVEYNDEDISHEITTQDLELNPELAEHVTVGDEVEIPISADEKTAKKTAKK